MKQNYRVLGVLGYGADGFEIQVEEPGRTLSVWQDPHATLEAAERMAERFRQDPEACRRAFQACAREVDGRRSARRASGRTVGTKWTYASKPSGGCSYERTRGTARLWVVSTAPGRFTWGVTCGDQHKRGTAATLRAAKAAASRVASSLEQ